MSRLIPYEDRWKRHCPFFMTEARYWKEYAEELAMYNDNSREATRRHRNQLNTDFNIVYNAEQDLYKQLPP